MKKAISILLILATLMGCCTVFASCDKGGESGSGLKLAYDEDKLLDFDDASKVSANGLTASTDDVKTSTNVGKWDLKKSNVSSQKLTLTLDKTDLSHYEEISIWMNNTASKPIQAVVYANTSDSAYFKASADYIPTGVKINWTTVSSINLQPGWHQYNLPLSQFVAEKGDPIKSSIQEIVIDCSKFSIPSDATILVDSVYAHTQKYGNIIGFGFDKIKSAVVFYEDAGAYLFDQCRYVFDQQNTRIAVTADTKTTYVPVSVLAEHRGAKDIVEADGKVTFNYNSTSYEFTVGQEFEFVGVEGALNAGKNVKATSILTGTYVMIPMEAAAATFGYELFYDPMGLVVFSDTPDLYVGSEDPQYKNGNYCDYNEIYSIIEVIAFSTKTGAELLDDMDELHPNDGHTRLILNQSDFDRLKELVETDPIYSAWFKKYEARYAKGTSNYNSANPYFELSDGYRLLSMSRKVMDTLTNYAFLYKMTDNEDYAKKVQKTLVACTKFRDPVTKCLSWHPEHFLDTGELMYGYALAYDWCYDYLIQDEKDLKTIENGIWELGYGAAMGTGEIYQWWNDPANMEAYNASQIEKGLPVWNSQGFGTSSAPYNVNEGTRYAKFTYQRYNWTNNWNAVCNGGMMAMCFAFANVNEEFREASEYLLDCIMFSFQGGLEESYATDGGYPEGPGYWGYGTSYSIFGMSSMMGATGTMYGFENAPGFRESFYYINAVGTGALGTWNYHDAGVGTTSSEYFFWFAAQTGDGGIGALRYNSINDAKSTPSLWDLMWYDPANIADTINLKLDYAYYGIDTVTFRSDWTDDALFCGLHGGYNAAPHGNLDIGNFIVEFGGTRFFNDLGSDEYNLAGYNGNKVTYFTNPYRYWYYRERAEGQNTLVIDPTRVVTSNTNTKAQGKNFDQFLEANSQLLRFESGETSALAVVDMGCAYMEADNRKNQGIRGMMVTDNRSTVVIQDEMKLSNSHTVMWMGHVVVGAVITVSDDKQTALISYEGKTLLCSIVLPEGCETEWKFEIRSADYLPETGLVMTPGEYNRDGYQKLVAVAKNCSDVKLAVVCRLLSDGPHNYEWTDINNWEIVD